jgi:hypothetical protein
MASSEQIAHLGFIQSVINRMGSNSAMIKGWTVTLVAAIFALASKDSNQNFIFIALIAALLFGFLDAYYLSQEKQYRELYKRVAEKDDVRFLSMDAHSSACKSAGFFLSALKSVSIYLFYLPIILPLLLYSCALIWKFDWMKLICHCK